MTWSWLDRRVLIGVAAAVIAVLLLYPRDSVYEIHHAEHVTNFAIVDPRPSAEDWPWLRGPTGTNVVTTDQFPIGWQDSSAEGWRVNVPGQGRSTPIVWGSQLFLVTSDKNGRNTSLHSYQRSSGREMWHARIFPAKSGSLLDKRPVESSTPACDGQSIFVASAEAGRLWVTAVDLKGQINWQRDIGRYSSLASHDSSPVLYRTTVIVACDQQRGSYLAAVHRQTGKIIWRVRRPDGESSASPVIAQLAGRPQLILAGRTSVSSYNPATGELIWTYRWWTEGVSNTVAFDQERVYATSASPRAQVVCINGSGQGDVTDTHLVWSQSEIGADVPSPVYFQGHLFVLSDDGKLRGVDAATGQIEWRRKLDGVYATSPMIVGSSLVCINGAGIVTLIQAGPSGEVIAEHRLPESMMGSPVVLGDSVYLRTSTKLSKIVAPTTEPIVEKPDRLKRKL